MMCTLHVPGINASQWHAACSSMRESVPPRIVTIRPATQLQALIAKLDMHGAGTHLLGPARAATCHG